MNKLPAGLMLWLWMAISTLADSHELKQTTARIILRDGQVEMQLSVDMGAWLETLSDEQSWLLGDIDYLYHEPMSEAETDDFVKQVIEQGTRVSLNGQPMTLSLVQQRDVGDNLHDRTLIVLQGQHSLTHVQQLDVSFPKSLGSVYISVARPHYEMVPGGQTAQVSLEQ